MDNGRAKGDFTPTEANNLVKDEDGEISAFTFRYSSFIGMLLYLSGHNHTDVSFDANFCARNMFCPKFSNKLALKKLCRYLKQLKGHGLVLNQVSNLCKL